jgi:hypothetical protein
VPHQSGNLERRRALDSQHLKYGVSRQLLGQVKLRVLGGLPRLPTRDSHHGSGESVASPNATSSLASSEPMPCEIARRSLLEDALDSSGELTYYPIERDDPS